MERHKEKAENVHITRIMHIIVISMTLLHIMRTSCISLQHAAHSTAYQRVGGDMRDMRDMRLGRALVANQILFRAYFDQTGWPREGM